MIRGLEEETRRVQVCVLLLLAAENERRDGAHYADNLEAMQDALDDSLNDFASSWAVLEGLHL